MDTLTNTERMRLVNYVTEAHNNVLHTAQPLSEHQLNFKEDSERWSIAEIVEHLTIIHNLVLSRIEEIILLPPNSVESAWKGRDDALLAEIRSRKNPVKVPDFGRPTNSLGRSELFLQFTAIRDRIDQFARNTTAPLRTFCFPHPTFGEKDCYQWLLGTGAHCERHLAQIREVMSADEFPSRV